MSSRKSRQERCYILPTRHGLFFLGGIVVMILTGATYNNNLIYLLSFVLFAILIVSMVVTNSNLKQVQFAVLEVADQCADLPVEVKVRLQNHSKRRIQWTQVRSSSKLIKCSRAGHVDGIAAGSYTDVNFKFDALPRGRYNFPRFRVESVFPLGLFFAWKIFKPEGHFYVYPAPRGHLHQPEVADPDRQGKHLSALSDEPTDFRGHRRFERGESQRRVDWKVFARSGKLLTKEFEGSTSRRYQFELEKWIQSDLENGLSQLSKWLLDSEKEGAQYALVQEGRSTNFGSGRLHLRACLRELASYARSA